MKLKRIKIKAFRLFDDVDISFVNQRFAEKGCANFVSIYAPNGFGKTSLFDAIEFGMTSNIRRLKQKNFKENMKNDKRLSKFSSFIHNKKSPNDDIYIRLDLEGYGDGVVERVISKKDEKKLLTGNGENKFFSEALLSQDWFSAFLSVNNASRRFKLFMENFHESQDLLGYHSELKSTLDSLKRENSKMAEDLIQLKKTLQNDIDEHIVERLNEMVADLDNMGLNVQWEQKIDTKNLARLRIEAEHKIAKEEAIKTKAENMLEDCEKLERGQEGLIAVNEISEHLFKTRVVIKQKADLDQKLKKVEHLKELFNLIENLKKEQKHHTEELTRLQKLVENFSKFEELQTELDAKKLEVSVYQDRLKTSYELISSQEKKLNAQEEARKEQKFQLNAIENKKKRLESDYAKYQNCLIEITQKQDLKTELTEKIAEQKAILDSKEAVSHRLIHVHTQASQCELDFEVEGYEELSERIIMLSQRILKYITEIRELGKSIDEQKSYLNQVSALVNSSRELVSELKTGVCPLCGHDYASVEQLLKSIEENKAISAVTSQAIAHRDELREAYKRDKYEREELCQTLVEALHEDLKNVWQSMITLKREIEKNEKAIHEADKAISLKQEQVNSEFAEFKGLTMKQVEKHYNESIEKLNAKIQAKDEEINYIEKTLKELNDKQKEDSMRLVDATKIISEIKYNDDYLEYKHLLGKDISNNTSLMMWNSQIVNLKETIAQFDKQINEAIEEHKELKKQQQIDFFSKASLLEELSKKINEEETLTEQYTKTLQFLKKNCGISGISMETTQGEIITLLEEVKKQQKEIYAYSEKNLSFLLEYMTMLGIVERYNQQQQIEENIELLNTKIEQNMHNQTLVSSEIKRLQDYLVDYVKNFFQVEQIQMLYNTIDPHPEYKEIRFACDFRQKMPQLNVYMRNKSGSNDEIVPTLYFSTAQINILSFCIFMAKALFAKTDEGQNVGCIFIDDPIQALDDINILSMIDLLRNVAFSLDRQIILTTHDRNFFELLQKKIPQTKFNSCFIRLEERGKFTVV